MFLNYYTMQASSHTDTGAVGQCLTAFDWLVCVVEEKPIKSKIPTSQKIQNKFTGVQWILPNFFFKVLDILKYDSRIDNTKRIKTMKGIQDTIMEERSKVNKLKMRWNN